MKTRSPTIAKVTRPIPTGVYPRKRLFNLLDRKRKYPVIWVSGPPGCGKTTMVTSYLENKDNPCLWYQADEGDADPATFFYYLGLAAKKATPRKRKPLPLLTPEYFPGLPTFTLRYFENLFQRLKAPSFLVFDNYQEVPVESPFHDVIRHGLSNIPKGINVILISRSEPPPDLTHMQANNLMDIIGWQDLRLTLKESNDIVRLQSRQEISKEAIAYIHKYTDGWLAGLMLMLKTAQIEKIDPRELDKVPTERIFDYFTGEIFGKADENSQRFLLQTAFLPKMTVSMAEALTGFESASRILSQLNRNHCFTERRFRSSPAYEYHPLFRDFLLSRAKETFSSEFLSDLRRRAAVFLEEADQTEAAIELMCDADDWEGMVQLIMKNAPTMLAQGRNRPLGKWLSSLPKDIFENTPWLLYWMAACRLPFDPSKSQRHFEKAFERFKGQKDAAGTFLAWAGVINSIFYAWEFNGFDKWFQVFEELMQTFETFPSKEIEGRVALSMTTALAIKRPEHPEFETWAERALSLARDNKDVETQVLTLFHAATHAIFTGGPSKAAPFLESLRELTRSSNVSPFGQITVKIGEASCHMFSGSREKCLDAVSKGLKISRESGVHAMDFILLGNAAECALEIEDLKIAGNEIGKMYALSESALPFQKAFYHHLRSREALIRNDLALAAYHAKLASDFVSVAGRGFNMGLCWLREAMILYRLGEYQQARRLHKNALDISRRSKSRIIESKALFTGAYFALDQGNETAGLKLLQKALAMAKELQYYFSADDDPSVTVRLCAKALKNGIEVDHVQEIIRKRKLVLDDPPLHLENWPWAIQIYTLGRFDMLIDGKPFKSSKKIQKKPLEMLKVLSSFGEGQEVSKVQLSDILWPDADGDKAQRSFDTTLYRLRQILGNDKAIIMREGRLSLDLRYCWVDSMAFEHILKQAEYYAKKKDRTNSIQSLEKAIALYKGPFLAGETDEPWAISYNERLRSKFLRAIERLGNYLEEKGDLNRAVDCFQKAIEVDDVAEMFYRRLMICLKKLDRRSDAISTYKRCEKTLSASLGLEPSPKTKAIKESLYE
jgi:ATP/maltotriose-dependent transcriptional regulator MalT/two-component SAPR family response regulator